MTEPTAGKSTRSIDEATLQALLEASAVISGTLDFATVLQAIAQKAAEVLNAEASSVILLDRARAKLVFTAAVGVLGGILIGEEFDAKLGIAGKVVESGEPVLVPDVQQHSNFFGGIDEKSSFVTRGMVVAPLRHRGRVLGVVEVLNKRGGANFVESDVDILQIFANLAALGAANAKDHEDLKKENQGLREGQSHDQPIIGDSHALHEVLALSDRVAHSNATVLLLGETGTGKELMARRVHAFSSRHNKPFIAINCAALPEPLLESELFGHEAGAFTGAAGRKLGRFELADGGTLFLDEIGDLSLSTQMKLLRVLQEREFVRVGGTRTISCDVRIIAATNRDLKRAIELGHFREDLYYRLNVFPIHLPPLRARREDIALLAAHQIDRAARELGRARPLLDAQALELLCAYRWPGNVRELRNVIERAVLLCDHGVISPAALPREIAALQTEPVGSGHQTAIDDFEKARIAKALHDANWNQTHAATALGISRDNLRYRLRKYQIRRPGAREE